MIGEQQDRPEGAPPAGVAVVHADLAIVGTITRYFAPGTYSPPVDQDPAQAHLVASREPVQAWCVELSTGDVLLWRPDAFTPLGPKELELLGGIAAGTEALFKAGFERAKVLGLPMAKAIELVLIAFRAQCSAIARTMNTKPEPPASPAPAAPAEPPPGGTSE